MEIRFLRERTRKSLPPKCKALKCLQARPIDTAPSSRTDCVNDECVHDSALTSVPDLSLDRLAVNVDTPRGELDADRRL